MNRYLVVKNLLWVLLFIGFCAVLYGLFIVLDGNQKGAWLSFFWFCIFMAIVGPVTVWMIDSTETLPAYLGLLAVAETDLCPEGVIRFKDGEKRSATTSSPPIYKGEEVTVTKVRDKGKTLIVGRANPPIERPNT